MKIAHSGYCASTAVQQEKNSRQGQKVGVLHYKGEKEHSQGYVNVCFYINHRKTTGKSWLMIYFPLQTTLSVAKCHRTLT